MTPSGRPLFNLVGGVVVVTWVILIGLLIKKTAFTDTPPRTATATGTLTPVRSAEREWMEIFLNGKKVGYSVNTVSPAREHYLIQEDIYLRMNLMGEPGAIHTLTQSMVDRSYRLKNFMFRMTSGVVSFEVSGTVKDGLLALEVGEGKGRRRETIRLSRPPVIGAGLAHFFKGRPLQVGQSFAFPLFDPSTLSQKEMDVRVARREEVRIGRLKYDAYRLEAEMWGQPMRFWLDETGTVLKEEGLMGLTLVKSSAANAPRDIQGGTEADFYERAAVRVDKKLSRPTQLTYLKMRIEGLGRTPFRADALNQGRQRFKEGIVEIVKEPVPSGLPFELPFGAEGRGMDAFLRPEINVESDDRGIVQKAREIARGERAPATVASRMLAWVYRELEKRPVLTVPSARQVLETKVGDCNEHAVLLTALLRAAGIPARICAGAVYARGKFYYHAWTEAYLGAWVSMDATLDQMPADATHLKLVEGGLDRQVEIIALIDKISLEVMDYRY